MANVDRKSIEISERSRKSADTRRRDGGGAEKPHGRYDRRTHNTRHPAQGLGSAPFKNAGAYDTTIAAIIDPMDDGKRRLYATVNRRVDILEQERSHERISEAAYRTGRMLQEIFERQGRVSGTNWEGGSRVDPLHAQRLKLARDKAQIDHASMFLEKMRGRLGMMDTRLLKRILGERMSFGDIAALQGKSGESWTSYYARRFREALEDVSEAFQSKGKVQPVPDDKHKTAADGMYERQAASIEVGVTAGRVDQERRQG